MQDSRICKVDDEVPELTNFVLMHNTIGMDLIDYYNAYILRNERLIVQEVALANV